MLIEKENMQSHTFDLIFHDSIQFYYSEHTVYCVHYLTKQIFFFNNLMIYDNDKMRYENFVAEFDFENLEKKCIVKTMPFYNEDQTDCLLDFSLCYSQTTIYLIWGNFQKNQIIFQDLYALDVTNHNWRIIKLKSMGIITPRLNASSACFNIQKTNSIFVFGGYVNLSNSEKDIHNSVDEISFNDGEDVAHHYQFPKANYKNNYKPLLDSQAIPIITLKTSPFYILLLGGTFSKFLCNQDRKPLTAYLIKIDSEEKKVYFENLAKHPEFTKKNHESLNLLFASKNKNYFFDNLNKKNGIVLSLFSTQKKGLFLEFYQNLEEEMDYDKIIQHQALKKYESFTHLELNSQKKEQKNKTQKFFYFTIKFDVFNSSKSLLEIKMKSQNKSLMLVQKISFLQNFFQMESNFENIFVDEESSELIIYSPKTKHKGENNDNEAFTIQKISFSANDLKKVKNWIGDYIPIKLKATNYLLKDNIVYILVNNEKDTDNQRNIYTIDLRNLDKNKKVALRKFYDENHKSFFKDCSFISDLNKIYVVGGEWADKEKVFVSRNLMIECDHRYLKSNFVLDINTKNSIFFKSNLNEMQNPYLIFSTEFLFCINRKIIYNPYLELSFFDKIDEKTRADILKSFRFNENYLYGEFIRKKNIDKEEWNCFLVDLQKYEIVLVISFTDGMKVIKNKREILEKNIIVTFGLIYLGKISKPEGAAFLLSFIDEAGRPLFPGLKQKRIFFIDFEEIQNSLYKNVEPKSIKNIDIGIEYFFLNEAEFLPRLKDYSLTEEEKGICFAKPNYQRISFNKEIKKMFKDIEN